MIDIDLCPDGLLSGTLSSPSSSVGVSDAVDFRIFFYPDAFDSGDFQEFDGYLSFMDFCDQKGYVIPDSLEWRMCYVDELHCTVCDLSGHGVLSVVGDVSYKKMLDLMNW